MLNNKSLQAFLAIGPLVIFGLLFISYFAFFIATFAQASTFEEIDTAGNMVPPTGLVVGFGIFFVLIMVAVFLSLFSLVYFIIHAVKNPNLEGENSNMRIVWILIMAFIGGIGQLIYWIVEIKSKNPRPIIPN